MTLQAHFGRGAFGVLTLAACAGGCGGDDGQRLSVWSERSLRVPVESSMHRSGIRTTVVAGESTALLERASAGPSPAADVVVVETFSPAPFDPGRSRLAQVLATDALVTVVPRSVHLRSGVSFRPRSLAVASTATVLGVQTRFILARDTGVRRLRIRSRSGGGAGVIEALLRGDADSGIVLRSTLRSAPARLRRQVMVVPVEGLTPTQLFVAGAVSRAATRAERTSAERWIRAAGTAVELRSVGLDAP